MAKTIIVDIDGVICQYDFRGIIKKHFGVDIKSNSTMWGYSVEDCLGLPYNDVAKMFGEESYEPPNMVPGAVKTLTNLIADGFHVSILSNRLKFMEYSDLEDWLDDSGIPYSELITFDTLPQYAHAMVDDSPSKLLCVDETIRVKNLILFDNPWNKKCLDILNKFQRARNWKSVKEIIYG